MLEAMASYFKNRPALRACSYCCLAVLLFFVWCIKLNLYNKSDHNNNLNFQSIAARIFDNNKKGLLCVDVATYVERKLLGENNQQQISK